MSNSAERGRLVLLEEANALREMSARLGPSFDAAIAAILNCRGRIVATGMGKHGLVARKIAATLSSTGTPCFFLHPAEAAHGDLGMIAPDDLVIALSNSGTTPEVLGLLPFIKRFGITLIAITGNAASELARQADIVLDASAEREVCPLNLAPTTTTTCAMAMGDALAVVLLEQRGFASSDFALRHPGGALGKRLLLRVGDVVPANANPAVSEAQPFADAVAEMTRTTRGAVSIVDDAGRLVGILTDGDLRRTLQAQATQPGATVAQVLAQPVRELMHRDPMRTTADTLAAHALSVMEDGPRKVMVLPVVDADDKPIAMLHLHDLIGAGI